MGVSNNTNETQATNQSVVDVAKDYIADLLKSAPEEEVEMIKEAIDEGASNLSEAYCLEKGTLDAMAKAGIPAKPVNKITCESPNILDLLSEGGISLIINTPTHGRLQTRDGFKLRRLAAEAGTACLTSLDAARVLLESTLIIGKEEIHVTDIAHLFDKR